MTTPTAEELLTEAVELVEGFKACLPLNCSQGNRSDFHDPHVCRRCDLRARADVWLVRDGIRFVRQRKANPE